MADDNATSNGDTEHVDEIHTIGFWFVKRHEKGIKTGDDGAE